MTNSEGNGSRTQARDKAVREEAEIYADEIDLREYAQVLIKRKKLIIGAFLVAVVLSAIASLLLPKVYKASASIMVAPKPTISIPTHQNLLKSAAVLQEVIGRLRSSGKSREDLSLEEFARNLDVKSTRQSDVLSLSVKDRDPARAKEAVDIWVDEYVKYSQQLIKEEILGSGEFVLQQFKRTAEDLAKADAAVRDFDVKERLSLMRMELAEDVNQLVSHYGRVHKLEFSLAEKRYLLLRTGEDIAAMTKNGVWLGAFDITAPGEKQAVDDGLNDTQKALRQRALEVKLALDTSRKKRDDFVSESGVNTLEAEVTHKRQDLLVDKALLAQIGQLSETTEANLKAEKRLETLKQLQVPVAESMSDMTVWEIMSLAEGYNFFETRGRTLATKLDKQEKVLKDLEKAVFDCNDRLWILDENLARAQLDYDFYHEKFKALVKEKDSAELEIAMLESELAYSKDMVGKLEGKVEALKTPVNEKTLKLAELQRELELATKAYESMALQVRQAEIARTMGLGEVKVVSTAFQPISPAAPNRKRIVAAAGIGGLMLGVFAAFFLEAGQKREHAN